jgi:hypothetical protein
MYIYPGLPGYGITYFQKWLPVFWRNLLPPSSGYKSKPGCGCLGYIESVKELGHEELENWSITARDGEEPCPAQWEQ